MNSKGDLLHDLFSIDLLLNNRTIELPKGLKILFMTNSDYFFKAAIKKVTEKLNEIVSEKIEEATNIAQDAPEIIKKEFDTLKEAIIEEAAKMEREMSKAKNNNTAEFYNEKNLNEVMKEIDEINEKIEQFNIKMNKTN